MFTKNISFVGFKKKKNSLNIKRNFQKIIINSNHVLNSLSKSYKYSYNINQIKKYKKFNNFRIIGMGGSILGTETIYDFLKHKIKKNFLFVDNLQNNQKDFLPVYNESLDDLRGVIDLYGITSFLSNEDKSIESLIESLDEAYFIPENTPLSTQLFNFQKNKKTVAVIIDEYGSVKGLVTIKDVLEEIVGELATDIDRETVEIMEQKDGSYLIDASIPLRELNKKLNWQLPINGAKTLNGLIIDQVETIPENNIKIEIENYSIETVLIRNNMIKIARVLQIEQEDEELSDD